MIFFSFQVFSGNQDRDSIVYHKLARQITARYIRFIPVEWQSHISMRVEIYGCAGTSWCILLLLLQ